MKRAHRLVQGEFREALEGMCWQFAYSGVKNGKPVLHTGGLSTLEYAFKVLGWDDPYFYPYEDGDGVVCDIKGCVERSQSGLIWGTHPVTKKPLYLRLCTMCAEKQRRKMPCPAVKQGALDRESKRGEDGTLKSFSR